MGARLSRTRYVGCKVETTKGTAVSLTGTEYKILAEEAVIDQDINFAERHPAGLAFAQATGIDEEHIGRARIKVELKGSGSAGTIPTYANLFLGCGFVNTSGLLTPSMAISAQQTLTIETNVSGRKKQIKGAMGSFTIEGETGKRLFVTFDMLGVWVTPTDASAPSITHETTLPLRFAGATFELESTAIKVSRFSINWNADVQGRHDPAPTAGVLHAYLADANPTMTMDPEAQLVADEDVYGALLSRTEQALEITAGSVEGNIVTITGAAVQYRSPKEGNRNGLDVHELECSLNASAGNDELTIDFTG